MHTLKIILNAKNIADLSLIYFVRRKISYIFCLIESFVIDVVGLVMIKEIIKQRNNPLYKDFTIGWNSIRFIMIGWDPPIRKRVNYLSCMEGERVWKIFDIFHNSTRSLFLYYKISFGMMKIMQYFQCNYTTLIFWPQNKRFLLASENSRFLYNYSIKTSFF